MTQPSALERTALVAILDELGEGRAAIEAQLLQASVSSRENSGGGFFTELGLRGEIPARLRNGHLGRKVWIAVQGMTCGLGMILHFKGEALALLEGYAVALENTASIDFERAPFALVPEPGPLPADRR